MLYSVLSMIFANNLHLNAQKAYLLMDWRLDNEK